MTLHSRTLTTALFVLCSLFSPLSGAASQSSAPEASLAKTTAALEAASAISPPSAKVKRLPAVLKTTAPTTRLGFGSCLNQKHDMSVFAQLTAESFDAFFFMGDNIYADTLDPGELAKTYQILGSTPSFIQFAKSTPLAATWDDHDYGVNDAGAAHPIKAQSQKLFLDFFAEPKNSPRRNQEGIYSSHFITKKVGSRLKKLQVIILDTRYNRSDLTVDTALGKGRYQGDSSPDKTFLGKKQWTWLQKRLREPADIRLLISSIEVIADEHPFERWGTFPLERTRLLEIWTKATGKKLILSGDRHFSEYSCLPTHATKSDATPGAKSNPPPQEICDWTLSGLNMALGSTRPELLKQPHPINQYRQQIDRANHHYGLLTVDWNTLELTLETKSDKGQLLYSVKM